MSKIDNVDSIASALITLLREADAADQRDRDARPQQAHITPSPAVLWYGDKPILTAKQCEVADLLDRPLKAACRLGIRRLGQQLYDLGGQGLMHDIADQLPDETARHISILDSAWNGVGFGTDRWWS